MWGEGCQAGPACQGETHLWVRTQGSTPLSERFAPMSSPVKSLSAILSGSGKRSVRRRAAKASQVTRPGRAGRCDGAGSEATSSELAVGTVTAQDPAVM